jgi:hypothetical protein
MIEILKGLVFVGGWMLLTALLMACVGGVIGLMLVFKRRKQDATLRDSIDKRG